MNICWFEYASWLPRARVMSGGRWFTGGACCLLVLLSWVLCWGTLGGRHHPTGTKQDDVYPIGVPRWSAQCCKALEL